MPMRNLLITLFWLFFAVIAFLLQFEAETASAWIVAFAGTMVGFAMFGRSLFARSRP